MSDGSHLKGKPHHHTGRVLSLLGAQILLLILLPLDIASWMPVRKIVFSFVILMAINQAGSHRRTLYIAIALATPALLGNWLDPLFTKDHAQVIADFSTLLLFLYLVYLMVGSVLRAPAITMETILLSICSYIMLGFLWVAAYHIVIVMHADGAAAFTLAREMTTDEVLPELYYYSFVTLTTLGFGDISPVAPMARSLTILEAISGPLFLAVLIAYLVGKFAATDMSDDS